jgi:hypothetical protein
MKNLMSFLVVFLMVPMISFAADELSGESKILNLQQRMDQIPNTIVVRIKGDVGNGVVDTSKAEVLFTGMSLPANESSQELLKNAEFQSVKVQSYSEKNEANRDSSQSAWYFGLYYSPWGNWGGYGGLWNSYYPSYWYGASAYSYSPYYSGYWGGYSYGYYRWW